MEDLKQGEISKLLELGAASGDPNDIFVKGRKPGVCVIVKKIRMQTGSDDAKKLRWAWIKRRPRYNSLDLRGWYAGGRIRI